MLMTPDMYVGNVGSTGCVLVTALFGCVYVCVCVCFYLSSIQVRAIYCMGNPMT